jgi:hypothetical protein
LGELATRKHQTRASFLEIHAVTILISGGLA